MTTTAAPTFGYPLADIYDSYSDTLASVTSAVQGGVDHYLFRHTDDSWDLWVAIPDAGDAHIHWASGPDPKVATVSSISDRQARRKAAQTALAASEEVAA